MLGCRVRYPGPQLYLRFRYWLGFGMGTRGAGKIPGGVAIEGVGEELKGSAADSALEVVFDRVGGPLRLKKILQWAGARGAQEDTRIDQAEQAIREFKVLARLIDRATRNELITPWAGCHWTSVPLSEGEMAVPKVLG